MLMTTCSAVLLRDPIVQYALTAGPIDAVSAAITFTVAIVDNGHSGGCVFML